MSNFSKKSKKIVIVFFCSLVVLLGSSLFIKTAAASSIHGICDPEGYPLFAYETCTGTSILHPTTIVDITNSGLTIHACIKLKESPYLCITDEKPIGVTQYFWPFTPCPIPPLKEPVKTFDKTLPSCS